MKYLLLYILLIVIVESCHETLCPNDCSGNGYCYHHICHCFDGFAGSDCSIECKSLDQGEWFDDDMHLLEGEWHYYKIMVPGYYPIVKHLQIEYYERRSFDPDHYRDGDGDIYIGRNFLPSKEKFDLKDETNRPKISFNIANPEPGFYFVGIFGVKETYYNLKFLLVHENENPKDSGNSMNIRPIEIDEEGKAEFKDSILAHSWQHYTFTDTYEYSGDMEITVTNIKDNKYPHIMQCEYVYLNSESPPNRIDYIAKNESCKTIQKVLHFEYDENYFTPDWYLGIYGVTDGEFLVTITIKKSCTNHCSHRGMCLLPHESCECDPGYKGDNCQTMKKNLPIGPENEWIDGFVMFLQWNRYSIQTNNEKWIRIEFEKIPDDIVKGGFSFVAPIQLLVKRNGKPTAFDYDYSSFSSITLYTPGTIELGIGVFGWGMARYHIRVISEDREVCPFDCSSHGICNIATGACDCIEGYVGESCQYECTTLSQWIPVSESIGVEEWQYYRYETEADEFNVILVEMNTKGAISIVLRRDSIPDFFLFDYWGDHPEGDIHTMVVHQDDTLVENEEEPSRLKHIYYLGVWGNDNQHSLSLPADYDMVVFDTPIKK